MKEAKGGDDEEGLLVGTVVNGMHDYTPEDHSRNDDGMDEELSFAAGDRMVIISELDPDMVHGHGLRGRTQDHRQNRVHPIQLCRQRAGR